MTSPRLKVFLATLPSRVSSPVIEVDSIRVRVIDLEKKEVTAEVYLENANEGATGPARDTLTFTDNLGRIVVLGRRRNQRIRNFRPLSVLILAILVIRV
jgi:hypothetical protein